MPNYNKNRAKGAIASGSLLAALFQNVQNAGSQDQIDKGYLALTDVLNVMGVDIKLDELKDELKRLNQITREEAVPIVLNFESRFIIAIERSCGPTVSAWFELSFWLATIAASPASVTTSVISTLEEDLKSAAIRAGYAKSKLDNVLHRLRTDDHPEHVISDFMMEANKIVETPRLFISYATDDHQLAEEIADLCRRANIGTFVANIDIPPGTDWYNRLGDEIRQADELLVIISQRSIHSPWVMIEVGAAWALGKGIIPAVLYENIDSLPEPIKRFQAQKIISTTQRKNLVKKIAQRMHNQG